jgi:hypothetical protein
VREPESPTLHGAGDQLGREEIREEGKAELMPRLGIFGGMMMVETPLVGASGADKNEGSCQVD